jgi:NADPH:quinone reductase-like Zn-dependent oxidoreductase
VYTRLPNNYKGTVAQYALSTASVTAKKPIQLSFTQAAAIPLAALTALQSLESAEASLGGEGSLKGKTVFIPGGLSGTGSFACQLAKNVFGAGKVITTLSTSKIKKAEELLDANILDQVVDYTKEDVVSAIGHGQVDFLFDTVGTFRSYVEVMKKGSVIVAIGTLPSGSVMAQRMPSIPFYIRYALDLVNWFYTWTAGRYGAAYSYIFMRPSAKDLEKLAWWVGEGKVKPIVGRTAKLSDIKAVREGCQEVYDAKGGIGKFVIEIV